MVGTADLLGARILTVDDQDANVLLLECMLHDAGYTSVASTTVPGDVCELHRRNRYDLILLDLQMPGMDGFEVMAGLKAIEPGGYLPVLAVTAQPDHKLRALQAGARDFLCKPFALPEVLVRVRNMVETRLLQKELQSHNEVLERRVRERTAELQQSHLEIIFTMTRAAEFRDEDTGAHVQRISHYTRALSRLLGMNEAFVDVMFFASPMHDIGKIGIHDNVLQKPGEFTADEWKVMRDHTTIGAKILGNSKSPYLRMGAEIALNHHERWDGSGYPAGKRGEQIPFAARIMHICDIYDALRSKRAYKPPFDHARAMDVLMNGDERTRPAHFEPAILEAFCRNDRVFRDIYDACTGPAPIDSAPYARDRANPMATAGGAAVQFG